MKGKTVGKWSGREHLEHNFGHGQEYACEIFVLLKWEEFIGFIVHTMSLTGKCKIAKNTPKTLAKTRTYPLK